MSVEASKLSLSLSLSRIRNFEWVGRGESGMHARAGLGCGRVHSRFLPKESLTIKCFIGKKINFRNFIIIIFGRFIGIK